MKKICVLAIDRAKKDAADASKLLAKNYNLDIDAYLIVSKSFKETAAYKGDEADGYFKELVIDFTNDSEIEKNILSITSKYDFTIAHCIVESAIPDYRKVIPYIENGVLQDPHALELASEKSKMREAFMKMYPEITPRFIEVNRYEYNDDDFKNFSFPVIVKPNGLATSFLVKECRNLSELKVALEKAFESIDAIYEREHGVGNKSMIVEEFISGELYSVDGYVLDDKSCIFLPPVRVVTSYNMGLSGFYGYEQYLPTDLSFKEIEAANVCAQKTADSLGLKNSTIHVEMYLTSDGWKTVEIGPRIGGYRQELYKLSYGIEHFYNDLLVHFGKKPTVYNIATKYAAAIKIYANKEGLIKNISGYDDALKTPSLISLKLYSKIGDKSISVTNGGKQIIDAIFSNKDYEKMKKDIEYVRKIINIEVL